MKIVIGADIVPTKSNADLFAAGDVKSLFGTVLLDYLGTVDFRVFNLEVPLCEGKERKPIPKTGPNLLAASDSTTAMKSIGIDLLTLANNHIKDYGFDGILDTVEALERCGISYVGTGTNVRAAAVPYIIKKNAETIGVYACTENEFTNAAWSEGGANPYDPLESFDHVRKLKDACGRIIVLYHGGKEHYRYPSPMLQRRCRKFIDAGADLVLTQHSHCIGCFENYKDKTIVYGQGNFLFDRQDNEYWQTSLLVEFDTVECSVAYVPLSKVGNTVRMADGNKSAQILNGFYARSEEIKTDGFVERSYDAFADEYLNVYMNHLLTQQDKLYFRVLNKLSGYRLRKWYFDKAYTKQKLLEIENAIRCEAHRELLLRGISNREGKMR